MITHVLHDGTTLSSVEGYIVPMTAARLAYDVMRRLEGGNEHGKKTEIEGCGVEDDHGVRGGDVSACGVLPR